jgi:hypothetical protein
LGMADFRCNILTHLEHVKTFWNVSPLALRPNSRGVP